MYSWQNLVEKNCHEKHTHILVIGSWGCLCGLWLKSTIRKFKLVTCNVNEWYALKAHDNFVLPFLRGKQHVTLYFCSRVLSHLQFGTTLVPRGDVVGGVVNLHVFLMKALNLSIPIRMCHSNVVVDLLQLLISMHALPWNMPINRMHI
jgi:hypothetical protein